MKKSETNIKKLDEILRLLVKKIFQIGNVCMVKIQILLNIQKWAHLAHNPMAHNPLCRICFFVSTPTVSLLLPPVTYSSSARDGARCDSDPDGGESGRISLEISPG
jgi:hypothetical protein